MCRLAELQLHEARRRLDASRVGIPIGLALVGAYLVRPRRRDLITLAWILFGLFWAEAVLGGISVKVRLAWVSVTGHFLLAIALIGIALVMHHRASRPEGPRRLAVPRETLTLARAVYGLTIWVLVVGTLVTAAGPHGGDVKARRLGWPLGDVARVHGISVDLLVVLTLVLVVTLVRTRAPRRVLNLASLTVVVMTAQGILGYVQYFNRIPPLLVGIHVFGAVCVFTCVQLLLLEL